MIVPRRLPACLVLPLLAACGTESSDPAATPVTYSCCETLDVDRPYQPGQALALYWTVTSPDDRAETRPQVELNALLTGPFATEAELKAAATGTTPPVPGLVTFTAAPVRPSGTPGERPTSTIVIGPEAKPGYYNVVTSLVGDDGTTIRGDSVVRVVPRP